MTTAKVVNRLMMDDPERAASQDEGDWLAPILALEDPVGVLSVYVDADPALGAGSPPAWQAPVRAGLRDVVKAARLDWPREHRMTLEKRLEELEPELQSMLERRDVSRGRALFAAIEQDVVRRVAIHAVLPTMVAVQPRATILPLVVARQAGRPAGVVELSWSQVGISEWEFGTLRELETIELGVDLGGERGRPATNPAVPQSFPERDRFETGVGARVLARIREAGTELRGEAEERGWDTIVVDGDPRFLESLRDGVGPNRVDLVASPQPLGGAPAAEVADRVAAALRDRRLDDQRKLMDRLDDSAAATRDAGTVERALAEGRVEHLLLEEPAEGGIAAEEELLRRALETGAEITFVEGATAALGSDGVAALLRW